MTTHASGGALGGAWSSDAVRFATLQAHSPIGLAVVAPDGHFLEVNAAVSTLLGRPEAELMACSWQELTHADDLEVDLGLVQEVLDGHREGYRLAKRFLRPDGTVVWGDLSVSCVRDAEGVVECFISQIVDMSEQVKTAQALAESEAHFRMIVENASDVVFHSVEGILDWVSPTIVRTLGWSPEDVLGTTTTHLWHPDDQATAVELRDAVYAGQIGSGVFRFRRKDGTYAWLEAALQPVVEPDGRQGAVGLLREVTKRVAAQQALAESEKRYRLLAENSTDVVLVAKDGVLEWLSPTLRSALGWSPSDWEGHRFEEFTHPDDLELAISRRAEINAGATRVTTLRVRSSDGSYHWIEIHAGPYVDDSGHVDGILGSFRLVDTEVAQQELLLYQARFDDLTGALKRDGALDRLTDIGSQRRSAGEECGVLFIDVDDFKAVNDTLGHAAGDIVLKTLTDRMVALLRQGDTVARMGGDEFIVILEGIHGIDEALAIAEKIRDAAGQPINTGAGQPTRWEGPLETSVSIGVTLSQGVETGDAIVARADVAMYEAKKRGRNQVFAVSPPAT